MKTSAVAIAIFTSLLPTVRAVNATESSGASTYRHFAVEETTDRVVAMRPIPESKPPRWASDVTQNDKNWQTRIQVRSPIFEGPIPFVLAPEDPGEPFLQHNHQPSITWLPNGDLLAIWYSTGAEVESELTVLASRLRRGRTTWDPSSEFFKAQNRNMHGSSLFYDGKGTVYHFNGMGSDGGTGWARLALLMRYSKDNGVTWTPPQAIGPGFQERQQVISGTIMTRGGVIIQACDAVPRMQGGTALCLSADGGKTWSDPGADKPAPRFAANAKGEGTIAGIHAGVVELKDGQLMALGRGDSIGGRMPMSISADLGRTWAYHASPFGPIGQGQRLVLRRLQEGPILLVAFTSADRKAPEARGMTFVDPDGRQFTGHGMFAALSFDEGKTWPVRRLLTPGEGTYDGGAWTGIFHATAVRAEHAGYLAVTQSPDGIIHLVSSRLYYRFNLAWLERQKVKVVGVGQERVGTEAPVRISAGLFDQAQKDTLGLKEVSGAETTAIFVPQGNGDMLFNNHPQLAVFQSRLYVTWVGHPRHEVGEGSRVFYSSSPDGRNWARPGMVGPEPRASGGWLGSDTNLLCLLIKSGTKRIGDRQVEQPLTEYCRTTDGVNWSEPQVLIKNAMPSESAKRLDSGRFIMPCHGLGMDSFSDVRVTRIMYTDSLTGTGGWKEALLPQSDKVSIGDGRKIARAIEPSWYRRSDGKLVMLFRDLDFDAKQRSWRLLASVSGDDGVTWSKPILTNITDSDSMQCAGSLPDGSVYFVNNPVPTRRRVPLAITLSRDGVVFDKAFLVRATPPVRRFDGTSKTLGYSYPGSIVFNGFLYIAYATNKEDIETTRIPLKFLMAGS